MNLSELPLYEDLLLIDSNGYTRIGRITKKSAQGNYFQLASYENRKVFAVWNFENVTQAIPVSQLLGEQS